MKYEDHPLWLTYKYGLNSNDPEYAPDLKDILKEIIEYLMEKDNCVD